MAPFSKATQAKRKPQKLEKPSHGLKKREAILDRAALIARLHAIGEGRRALIVQRNEINEHEKLHRTYARDSPAYEASFERGHQMRENELRLAEQIRAAISPRPGMTPGNVGFRAGIVTPPNLNIPSRQSVPLRVFT